MKRKLETIPKVSKFLISLVILVSGYLAVTNVYILFPGFPGLSVTFIGGVSLMAVAAKLIWGELNEALTMLGEGVLLIAFFIGICQYITAATAFNSLMTIIFLEGLAAILLIEPV
jgi:hypothetical protein